LLAGSSNALCTLHATTTYIIAGCRPTHAAETIPCHYRPPHAGNANVDTAGKVRRARALKLRARGDACFDFPHYLGRNPDLQSVVPGSREQLWQHFVEQGQFEDRGFRFSCPAELGWLETQALWGPQQGRKA
jgi:hypothetical protein